MTCKESKYVLLVELPGYIHSNVVGGSRSEDTGKTRHRTVNELDAQVSLDGITYKPIVHISRFRILARLEAVDIPERKNYLFRKKCSHAAIKSLAEIGEPELICGLIMKQLLGITKSNLHISERFYLESGHCKYHGKLKSGVRKLKDIIFSLFSY